MPNRKYMSLILKFEGKKNLKIYFNLNALLWVFVTIHKNYATTSSTDENQNMVEQSPLDDVENINNPSLNQEQEDKNLNEDNLLEMDVEHDNTSSGVSKSIYDPGQWKNIDEKFRDLMIKGSN